MNKYILIIIAIILSSCCRYAYLYTPNKYFDPVAEHFRNFDFQQVVEVSKVALEHRDLFDIKLMRAISMFELNDKEEAYRILNDLINESEKGLYEIAYLTKIYLEMNDEEIEKSDEEYLKEIKQSTVSDNWAKFVRSAILIKLNESNAAIAELKKLTSVRGVSNYVNPMICRYKFDPKRIKSLIIKNIYKIRNLFQTDGSDSYLSKYISINETKELITILDEKIINNDDYLFLIAVSYYYYEIANCESKNEVTGKYNSKNYYADYFSHLTTERSIEIFDSAVKISGKSEFEIFDEIKSESPEHKGVNRLTSFFQYMKYRNIIDKYKPETNKS